MIDRRHDSQLSRNRRSQSSRSFRPRRFIITLTRDSTYHVNVLIVHIGPRVWSLWEMKSTTRGYVPCSRHVLLTFETNLNIHSVVAWRIGLMENLRFEYLKGHSYLKLNYLYGSILFY
ncbi:hypothetical protein QLX08_007470 [Tetragonisca angustula]|uniref:Uncharacterized protein n=1 Tax=Tetragonisca angustula TaxID=166442 RepID=A0AAW0ZPP4_9HYME